MFSPLHNRAKVEKFLSTNFYLFLLSKFVQNARVMTVLISFNLHVLKSEYLAK